MQKPFIIYTLRRTGGTSLTSFMASISSYPTVEHEPFNPERLWSSISMAVKGGLARGELKARLAEALSQRPNIKHCVEVVPLAITRALIDLCNELGYAQFVLHRRREKDRLFSLYMATATGAWGPKDAAAVYPRLMSGELEPRPIDLNGVASRIRVDAASLGDTLMRLRSAQIDFGWLIFEEIYSNPVATAAAARVIAYRMGIDIQPADPRLAVFSAAEGQGSARDLVPEARALEHLLDQLLG